MKKRFSTERILCKFLLVVLLFGLGAFPLGAQGFFSKISWLVNGTVLFFPEDNGMHSDPMPVLPSLGLGASYPFTKFFALELTWDLYFTHYGYDYDLKRAVPNAIENRTALVIGSFLGIQAVGTFDVTSFMTIRAYAGPAADLRIILLAEDLNEGLDDLKAIRKDVAKVRDYFWGSGRWFMPVAGVGVDFTLNSRFKLGIDMHVWMPMYRLWTGEDLPAIEGWRFGPGIRLTIR